MGRSAAPVVEALSDQVVRLTRTSTALKTQLAARHAGREDGVHGIEWAAYALLFHLVEHGPKRSSALAEAACVDPSTVSRQVAELVKAGLVERVPDPADGRASLLVATERGLEAQARRKERRVAVFGRIVADWSPEDVVAFTDLLNRFNDSFHDIRASLLEEMASDPSHDSLRNSNQLETAPS